MTTITGPGLWDVDQATYLADTALLPELGRSLSFSGAKVLLANPARFAWEREHGRPERAAFDFGHAAHLYVLGEGGTIARVDADSWRSKAAQDARTAAYAAGQVPLLAADDDRARALAEAVRAHPTAGAILSQGKAEQSLYWVDEPTGVTCRGRVDWLRDNVAVDVKTTDDASPEAFARSCANFRYDLQAAFYTTGLHAVTGRLLPFVFIAAEKAPPHFVATYTLDDDALDRGHRDMRRALDLYAECESSGEYPSYSTEIETLALPRWAR